ncbi:MAG: hypothetical protein WCP36_02675 [Methanomicrobiales archaeon]
MKQSLSITILILVVVIALVSVATPAFADDQYKAGGSFAKMTGGKSLIYSPSTTVYPSFTSSSLTRPVYQGMVSSGPSYKDLLLYANSNPPVVPIEDTSFSLPGPAYSWDTLFTSPITFVGCGCG